MLLQSLAASLGNQDNPLRQSIIVRHQNRKSLSQVKSLVLLRITSPLQLIYFINRLLLATHSNQIQKMMTLSHSSIRLNLINHKLTARNIRDLFLEGLRKERLTFKSFLQQLCENLQESSVMIPV